jgi:putative two-component system response regulator
MLKKISDKTLSDLSESIFKLGYIAEIHEWDNRLHLERISRYVLVIANSIGLTNEDATAISLASQLHDVGKFFTPTELLQSHDDLSPQNWKVIEKHTIQGSKFLESKNSLIMNMASTIALTHHERWDGSGYPARLKGEGIPLSGCICAVADVFDALTTHRPYKEIISDEDAIKMIRDSSGVLFNAKVVSAFEKEFAEIRKIKRACE